MATAPLALALDRHGAADFGQECGILTSLAITARALDRAAAQTDAAGTSTAASAFDQKACAAHWQRVDVARWTVG